MGPEPPGLTVGTPIRDLFVRYELPSGGGDFFGAWPVRRAESIQMVWEQLLYHAPSCQYKNIWGPINLMGVGR